MIVGISEIEIFISESNSLKFKRQIIKSIKTKLQNKYNISIAEVEHQNLWQRAKFGVAVVSCDSKVVDSTLNKVLDFIDNDPRVEVINYQMEKL